MTVRLQAGDTLLTARLRGDDTGDYRADYEARLQVRDAG
jgi:hypothetical protein